MPPLYYAMKQAAIQRHVMVNLVFHNGHPFTLWMHMVAVRCVYPV